MDNARNENPRERCEKATMREDENEMRTRTRREREREENENEKRMSQGREDERMKGREDDSAGRFCDSTIAIRN